MSAVLRSRGVPVDALQLARAPAVAEKGRL